MRRIFIGDIHGCYDELAALLARLEIASDDSVVSLGDIIEKGPAAEACLDLWIERGFQAVRGNQEDDVLQSIDRTGRAPDGSTSGFLMRRPDLQNWIRARPVWLWFPHEEILAVHGGVLPGITLAEMESGSVDEDALMRLRHVRRTSAGWSPVPKGEEREGDRFWADLWEGPFNVVYGHQPRTAQGPRVDPHAIGIDTGCVYGGSLTAAVFDGAWSFVSVVARRSPT